MSDKKSFVLRIDPEVMKRLEKWAADDFRSVNGQIEYILTQALRKTHRLNHTSQYPDISTDNIYSDYLQSDKDCSTIAADKSTEYKSKK